MKRYPIKRKTRLKPRAKRDRITKDGRKIAGTKSYTGLRMQKFVEAEGMCQCYQIIGGKPCGQRAPWPASGHAPMPWEGQLAHWPPKKMGNSQGSDDPEHTYWLVGYCHDKVDNRHQKLVPAKERA